MSLNYDLQKIKNNVKTSMGIMLLDEVSSTQEYLKSKINENVFCVISKSQTSGKGTNNRKFYSPSGGIYLSLMVKGLCVSNLSFLTPYAAVVVTNAIEKVCMVNPKIKWVNDVYLNDKKLSGILTETSISSGKLDYAIVGIGINVEKQNFPNFSQNTPISLEEECSEFDVNDIVIEILNGFLSINDNFVDMAFMETYATKSAIIGKTATLVRGSEKYSGVVKEITRNGELVLNVLGEDVKFISGEARLEK